MSTGKQHNLFTSASDNNDASIPNDEKKIIRRDIERQRRVQMSILFASLRSLLPFELIKGKRSVSDHIGDAANYIQYLKQKIHVLQIKRDKLKQLVDSSSLDNETGRSNHTSKVKCVSINPFPDGVEIAIDNGFEESSPHLSDLLQILDQEGCDVVSCNSTHANGRLFYSIKFEVNNLICLDLARLQQKLHDVILWYLADRKEVLRSNQLKKTGHSAPFLFCLAWHN